MVKHFYRTNVTPIKIGKNTFDQNDTVAYPLFALLIEIVTISLALLIEIVATHIERIYLELDCQFYDLLLRCFRQTISSDVLKKVSYH